MKCQCATTARIQRIDDPPYEPDRCGKIAKWWHVEHKMPFCAECYAFSTRTGNHSEKFVLASTVA